MYYTHTHTQFGFIRALVIQELFIINPKPTSELSYDTSLLQYWWCECPANARLPVENNCKILNFPPTRFKIRTVLWTHLQIGIYITLVGVGRILKQLKGRFLAKKKKKTPMLSTRN